MLGVGAPVQVSHVWAPEEPAPDESLKYRRWAMWVAVALVLVPLVANAIALIVNVGSDYYPWGDRAQLELRTRDIGSWVDMLGPYSRFHWFHPGPAMFYLFAPVYR